MYIEAYIITLANNNNYYLLVILLHRKYSGDDGKNLHDNAKKDERKAAKRHNMEEFRKGMKEMRLSQKTTGYDHRFYLALSTRSSGEHFVLLNNN